jgi:hypothetical protein
MLTDGCEYSCLSDPNTWEQNFLAYMAQKNDRTTAAANALYLDYLNQFGDIIELPEGTNIEFTLWQMAYEDTLALNRAIQKGGWFSNALSQAFGGGYIDALDVVEGLIDVILATSGAGSDNDRLPNAYSVAVEVELPSTSYPGRTRMHHNRVANRALVDTIDNYPEFGTAMEQLIPDLRQQLVGPSGSISKSAPAGWTWHHHPTRRGVMQLVTKAQHQSSAYQHLFHPNRRGGYSIWGD